MDEQAITSELSGLFQRSSTSFRMPVLEIGVDQLLPLVGKLRNELGYDLFLDVTAVDWPQRLPRFDVVYHFMCTARRSRLRIKLQVAEQEPTVPTLTTMYGSARFMEREVHEMYGIRFAGNDDLRPILLYEGFVGYPLRKDYPIDMEQPIVAYRK